MNAKDARNAVSRKNPEVGQGSDAGLPNKAGDEAGKSERVTPMIAQYLEIKKANDDSLLFYRMGDFYELFFHDAEIASQCLGIILTKRGKHLGDDIPMCGVPIERADDYLQRLIAAGHRVAVCEQTEDPAEARKRGTKSVVRREVVRIITPGTLTDERLLEPGQANLFVALVRVRSAEAEWSFGVAAVEISTGDFEVLTTDAIGLPAALARLSPREIVATEAILNDQGLVRNLNEYGAALAPLGRSLSDGDFAEKRLKEYYGVASLDGFGPLTRAEVCAAAAAVAYIEQTQKSARPRLAYPRRLEAEDNLQIDASTRANLELTRTMEGSKSGSLLSAIDRTKTSGGARMLASWLATPLRDSTKITARQDAVAFFVADANLRDDIRDRLKRVPDLMRALGRIVLDRGGPRDLAALREGLLAAVESGGRLLAGEPPNLLRSTAEFLSGVDIDLAQELTAALEADLPFDRKVGGYIRKGFDPALDEARELRDQSRRVIAEMQTQYSDLAETRQLKIKHNNFLGYFIEVPQAQGEKLLRPPYGATFIHRQTMAGAMRFSTTELAELEARISNAADEALAIERRIFDQFASRASGLSAEIETAAKGLALADVLTALAEIAVDADWVRPQVDDSIDFQIAGGRHPVVEFALRARGEAFVPNNCDLSAPVTGPSATPAGRIAVVTGPNMAGKSTFLRQNALMVILAQIGSFVPARSAKIGVVDRLFSRVGASDDLARGRSTFMVEMVETAAILNLATHKSVVILDEIGRGTATYDGLSIAWAVMEHIHEVNRARALFATHFHELTHLGQRLTRLVNLCMRVTDWNGEVVFLHEVGGGAADRSYGVQVARLAGLPRTVIERAKEILAELEKTDRHGPIERLVSDLPLFARLDADRSPPTERNAVVRLLEAMNPDEMTPREALEAIYALKKATNS